MELDNTDSTVIENDVPPAAVGGGEVVEAAEPQSLRADIEAAMAETKTEPAKADEEVKEEPAKEADRAEPGKEPEKKEEAKPEPKQEEKSEPRQRDTTGKFAEKPDAPANFLPKAKEVWRNTPHAVQSEVARMVADHQNEMKGYQEKTARYESIREFDELAQSNGRELKDSLARMAQVEDMLQSNPIAGLNAILMEIGPRKADGQPYSIREVASFIAQQDDQGYNNLVSQRPQPQQQQDDPRIAQLEQRIQSIQTDHLRSNIIEPFRAAHPRYDELQDDIALFLNSAKIPVSLSPSDRLAAAYDMAERINPPSHGTPRQQDGLAEQRGVDEPVSSRSPSIKSSPGSVTEDFEPEAKGGESIRESLQKAARTLTRA